VDEGRRQRTFDVMVIGRAGQIAKYADSIGPWKRHVSIKGTIGADGSRST
jgi:hypothetical protein